MRRIPRAARIALALVVAAAVLVIGGALFYTKVIEGDPPDAISLDNLGTGATPSTAGGTAADPQGTWKVATGSQVGYRVKEILFGQSATAVGRTSQVTGSFTVDGTAVTAATFTADLASVSSDRSQRDNQFRGRIMDVSSFPTATFALGQPIALGTIPPAGETRTVDAIGSLTLHGTTRTVTVSLQAVQTGAEVKVVTSIPIVFADYGIPNPSFGPAQTDDHGTIEVGLVLAKA